MTGLLLHFFGKNHFEINFCFDELKCKMTGLNTFIFQILSICTIVITVTGRTPSLQRLLRSTYSIPDTMKSALLYNVGEELKIVDIPVPLVPEGAMNDSFSFNLINNQYLLYLQT